MGAIAPSTESIPRCAATPVGGRADVRVVVPEPPFSRDCERLCSTSEGTHLRDDEPSHAPPIGPNLTFQTVLAKLPSTTHWTGAGTFDVRSGSGQLVDLSTCQHVPTLHRLRRGALE